MEAFAADGDRAWVGGNFVRTAPRTGPGTGIDLSGTRIPGYAELTDSTDVLTVDAVASDGSGGWFVAGTFTKAAGVGRPGLVHLNPDGSVDQAFNAQATPGTINALTVSGGLLYVGGSFVTIAGNAHSGLAALDASTGADAGWIANVAGGKVNAIAIQGGFAWVGGSFTSIGGQTAARAAKVATGVGTFGANPNYQPNPDQQVRAIVATASAVYIGGDFTTFNAGPVLPETTRLAKTDPTSGAPDATWVPQPGSSVYGLASDGTSLYAAGSFTSFGGQTRRGTAATALTGTGAATGWYPGDLNQAGTPTSIAVAGGTVYIGGNFQAINGGTRTGLAASPADATGGLTAWDPQTTEGVNAVAANGSAVYAGGVFSGVGAVQRQSLMALDLLTGAPMPFFSHTFSDTVHTITVCGDTVYVGGVFFTVDGQQRLDAAAFDRNTGALLPWDPGPDGDVWSIACGNGVVYLGGQFVSVKFGTPQQVDRHGLAAVDPVTGAYTSWNPAGADFPFVNSVLVDGATVYAGGQFNSLGGVTRNNIAAIDGVSGALTGWDPNVSGAVRSLVQNGSTLFAGGDLSAVGGNARGKIAEINLSDGTPTAFDPQTDSTVMSLARAPDGTLYAGGRFTAAGGVQHRGVAAIRPDGTVTGWDPQLQGDANAVAAGSDGRIYVGGNFTGLASRGALAIATFSEPTSFATQPALTSAPGVGQATTCDPGTQGGSLPAPRTIQWQLDGADIGGATGASYTPTTTDAGHALSCRVSQRNMTSTAQADSASMTVAAVPVQTPPPVPFDIDGFATPPPPVAGKSVIATPIKGTVTVLLPGFKKYIPLPDAERIPVRSIIDARHGTVRLTTVGAKGKLQSAVFYEGVFQVFQDKGRKPIVELRLYGGNFKVCPRISRKAAALSKVAKTKSIRHLWGEGKGLFRTKGRYASATIRGTKWLTDDRCDGTLVRVTKGAVTVRDLPKKKSLVLRARKKYLALARR